MLVELKQSIVGIKDARKSNPLCTRIHGKRGDKLKVLFINHNENGINWYICDSKHYPKDEVIIFPSQCTVIYEKEKRKLDLEQDDLFFGQEEDDIQQEEWDKY